LRDPIEKNEMSGHAALIGRGEVHRGFWWRNVRERDHLEDPGVIGMLI